MEPPEDFDELLRSIPGLHARNSHPGEAFFASLPERTRHLDQQFLHILLDNLGIVAAEQVIRKPWEEVVRRSLEYCSRRWQLGKTTCTDHVGWQIPSAHSVLRLLPEDPTEAWPYETQEVRSGQPEAPQPLNDFRPPRFWSWSKVCYLEWDELRWGELVWPTLFESPELGEEPLRKIRSSLDWNPAYGATLPDERRLAARGLHFLSPRHSTPDLPSSVGTEQKHLETYRQIVQRRSDSGLPTCVSLAICMALELSARRNLLHCLDIPHFSAGWLHCKTGPIHAKRSLSDCLATLRSFVIPSEESFPHSTLEDGRVSTERLEYAQSYASKDRLWTHLPMEDVVYQFDRSGDPDFSAMAEGGQPHGRVRRSHSRIPLVQKLEVTEIGTIKSYLAAGWCVVVTTRISEGFDAQLRDSFCGQHGLPMLPIWGGPAVGAYAWCLVGYDHVDRDPSLNYQGRFVALHSWGAARTRLSPYGPGTISLPFSFVALEGIEAVAVRFR